MGGSIGSAERQQRPPLRVIKRYSNRKLYDTKESTYVTLLDISDMVRSGEQVQIVDNTTKEDKTEVTLAQVLSEELKASVDEVPLAVLEAIAEKRGARLVQGADEMNATNKDEIEAVRGTLEQCQKLLDERLLPERTAFQKSLQGIERRLDALTERLDALEERLGSGRHS